MAQLFHKLPFHYGWAMIFTGTLTSAYLVSAALTAIASILAISQPPLALIVSAGEAGRLRLPV